MLKGYYEGYSYVVVKDGIKYRFANEDEAKEFFEDDEIENNEEEVVQDGTKK